MQITVLGSGTSQGVPLFTCDCEVCLSEDPRDKRTRTSIYVTEDETSILVDTTPDLRFQCIQNGIREIDGVLYTHSHADHIFGMDDLRAVNYKTRKPVPIFGTSDTFDQLKKSFSYAFDGNPHNANVPLLDLFEIDGPFQIGSIKIVPLHLMHQYMPVLGFKFISKSGNSFSYMTDCSEVPKEAVDEAAGSHSAILDGLRFSSHPKHLSISEACVIAKKLKVQYSTYLTHMTHEVLHARDEPNLPAGVKFAYDGLKIVV